jgi:hypothetical protein
MRAVMWQIIQVRRVSRIPVLKAEILILKH